MGGAAKEVWIFPRASGQLDEHPNLMHELKRNGYIPRFFIGYHGTMKNSASAERFVSKLPKLPEHLAVATESVGWFPAQALGDKCEFGVVSNPAIPKPQVEVLGKILLNRMPVLVSLFLKMVPRTREVLKIVGEESYLNCLRMIVASSCVKVDEKFVVLQGDKDPFSILTARQPNAKIIKGGKHTMLEEHYKEVIDLFCQLYPA